MAALDELLRRNRVDAAARSDTDPVPRQAVLVLTCLDARTDPAAFLGLRPGEAPVLRNAGGRVTAAVIEDVAFTGALADARGADPAGPLFEVLVIHHTQCGTGLLAGKEFRRAFGASTGYGEAALIAKAVSDPAATVAADVATLRAAPQFSPRMSVSGHVYDLTTGLVTTIVPTFVPTFGPHTTGTET